MAKCIQTESSSFENSTPQPLSHGLLPGHIRVRELQLLTKSNHCTELTSIITGDLPYTVSVCICACVCMHTHALLKRNFHLHKESGKYKFKMHIQVAKTVKSVRYWVGCGQQELLQKSTPTAALGVHQASTSLYRNTER